MNVKTRIWLLPVLAAAIFAVGILVVLGFSDFPFVDATTQFSSQLEALGATIQSAVAEGEKKRLDEAKDRAVSLRKLLEAMARLDGKSATATQLKASFEAYFAASVDTAELFLGIKTGDQAGAIPKMQATLKTLEADVAKARAEASESSAKGLERADAGVSASVTAIVVSGVVVVAALGLCSFFVIGSALQGGPRG